MLLTIIIAFFSLLALVVLHELGHFFFAKKFGVKVEEFGVGLPPRIFGKKIGETIYSLNALPFGAFVRLYGEEKTKMESFSFSVKPIWQRALIIFGGVMTFWAVSFVILSVVLGLGAPTAISDNDQGFKNPKVQIVAVSKNSPVEAAELKIGDVINVAGGLNITKVGQLQDFIKTAKGKEIVLEIQRGKEIFNVKLTPRSDPPAGEGPLGVALARTAIKSYSWYKAPFHGFIQTINLTKSVVLGWVQAIASVGKGESSGVQVMGPVGIFNLFGQVNQLGAVYFLQFLALISVYFAMFNILPIPALDGGKLLFLAIEAFRRKPVNQKIEQNITAVFFFMLIGMIIFFTIKDVIRIF